MRCDHCPLDPSLICRGEQINHFCRLVDPKDPIYTPAYIRILERDDVVYDGAEQPTLVQKAVSLAGAAARVAGAVLTGQPVKVAPEVYSERLEICRSCEHYELATGRCRKCGCSGLKLELATEKCPIGKWS